MKKRAIIISILISIVLITSAQVPQKFNYQAVVRNSQNEALSNQVVGFRMSVLKGSTDGEVIYAESHSVTSSSVGLADLLIGGGEVLSGTFSNINWGDDSYFLKVEFDPAGGTSYNHLGTTQLISVPYSLYSGNISSPTRKFTIQEEMGHPVDSALFEVKNHEGQTVFAVYPEGTRVYILDEQGKGIKGGFAVGGYSRSSKGTTNEYMRVTPDSIRLYIDESSTKGHKGGFAVGGYSRSAKGPIDQYMTIKPDSAQFLMVSDQPEDSFSSALSVTTKSRFGGDNRNNANLFNLTRDNYFIGHRAGEAIAGGAQNCFFGFESGANTTEGYGNIFIGKAAGFNHVEGNENTYIGTDAGQANTTGNANVYIGTRAGANNLGGKDNIFVGFEAGMDETGNGKLYIDLFSNTSDNALIYGEFYNNAVRINNRLGIGMMARPEYALEVQGEVAKTTAGDWEAVSDARIKTDVTEIDNACEQILALRPVRFRYTDEWMGRNPAIKDKVYFNFIAQEFREVFPQAVQTGGDVLGDENSGLLQLDSYPAQVVAIKAIQELIEENRKQQQVIGQLQQRLLQLEETLIAQGF